MSPILVRPVREQLEHDRVIRLLQAKYKRKFEVAINPGNVQTAPVGAGPSPWYPDLVLQSNDRARKLVGVVEVETAESINHLEAMSQWAALSKLRVSFHLYVPAGSIDSARRLCTELQISVAEIWTYHAIGDQYRFTLVQRSGRPAEAGKSHSPAASRTPRAASRSVSGNGRVQSPKASSARSSGRATAVRRATTTARPTRPIAKPAASRTAAKKRVAAPARSQKRK